MTNEGKNKKLTNDEKRIKIVHIIVEANNYINNGKYHEAEKLYLKACRLAENVYRQTMSNKDSKTLLECYMKTCEFYEKYDKNLELLQRWYQKIVYIKDTTCQIRSSLEEYHELLEWYVATLFLMKKNNDFDHMISFGLKMNKRAKNLYNKTKTNEDIKFLMIAELYIAEGYNFKNKKVKSYFYYRLVALKMEKVYREILDEGLKYDLIDVYDKLCDLTSKKFFKLLNRKWQIKKQLLKGAN